MSSPMRIAIASGKGGTGKTTVATSLAVVSAELGHPTAYLDCDVEEPNGHIFLKPSIRDSRTVTIPVPHVDEARCTGCGACSQACRHSAIVVVQGKVITFPELCHGCGGCMMACPEDAIQEVPRPVGIVERGLSGPLPIVQGRLDVGEAMATPVVKAVIDDAPKGNRVILDAPPGTSCPVMETVKAADAVLLVTEPTPFGVNDLKLAVGMVRTLGLPMAVVVNRAGIGDGEVYDFCREEGIPVLLRLPDDRRVAEAYSRGKLAALAVPHLRPYFERLLDDLEALAHGPRPGAERRVGPVVGPSPPPPSPSERIPAGPKEPVRELVVVSGKGGTGKTSIVSSFFAMAEGAAVADCDVDAADLHLVLAPRDQERWTFSGGSEARIDETVCAGCGVCAGLCRFDAIRIRKEGGREVYEVDPVSCEGCGVCADACPEGAAEMVSSTNGEWFVSSTRHGPMVHARLGIAQENSGKLVSLVRREAMAVAGLEHLGLLIVDGSPGIGCPVIASITGAHLALIVTEPTLSGLHDMRRLAELTRHFQTRTVVCINKFDINPDLSNQVEREAKTLGLTVLGRIRYDPAVTRAQVYGNSVVEEGNSPASRDIRALWGRVQAEITLDATEVMMT